jgi:hypothetical protein
MEEFLHLGDELLAFHAKFFGLEFLFSHWFLHEIIRLSAAAVAFLVHPAVELLDGTAVQLP